jgi:Erythronolide synthase docking domain
VTVSFVLRLVNDSLQAGQVVGQAENVATGERHVVGDVEELVEFLRRSTTEGERA